MQAGVSSIPEASGPLPGPAELRPLGTDRAATAAAVEVVAHAFRDNPLNVAVIGSTPARRIRSNRAGARVGFAAPLATPPPLRLAAWARPSPGAPQELAGVLLALAPGGFPAPAAGALAQLCSLWGQGWRTAQRWGDVYQALFTVHPREPHWYLDILAVAPAFQRRGLGRALLAGLLARVDAERQASYLETDRSENLAFYRAAGYEVLTTEWVVGTDVWCLWRGAR